MRLLGRQNVRLGDLTNARNAAAVINCLFEAHEPIEILYRYLTLQELGPSEFHWRTPVGPVSLSAWNRMDVVTQFITFCRHQYRAGENLRTVVDFGSNIGISAAYFLSRTPRCKAFLFEPNPLLHDRLARNLAQFEGRFALRPVCITADGREVDFGIEETGVFSGAGKSQSASIRLSSSAADEVLTDIIETHGRISMLKIDIEGLEGEVLRSLSKDVLGAIDCIYAELDGDRPQDRIIELPGFSHARAGLVHRYAARGRV